MGDYITVRDDIFDFVIIGSGFGGSVAAMRLSEKGYRVLVMERGKRYGAEDFPKTNLNVFKYLWLPALRCFGFQGLDFFKDIWILTGSGVGGGSLVYACTHITPGKEFFEAEEWGHLADWQSELEPHYKAAKQMLGVTENPKLWPADKILYDIARDMGQEHTFVPTPVAVFFGEPGKTVPDPYFDGQGPDRAGCIHCGGCMVGCQHNAKNSLDKNYLYFAEKMGAEVRPETNVTDIWPQYGPQKDGARYEIVYERTTDWILKRHGSVRARNVVISAGVLGTIDLMLKCRDESQSMPNLSGLIGRKVRSNSEALMGVTAYEEDVDYSEGVAISSHFWLDEETSVEPVRYPAGSSFMRNLTMPLADLGKTPWNRIKNIISATLERPRDFFTVRVKPGWARKNTVVMVMQTVENRVHFKRGRDIWTVFRRRLVSERDKNQPIPTCIDAGREVVSDFAERANGAPWTPMNELLLGTPSTAHVLGGCPIGTDATTGVIDLNHEVFNYPGMYIADGSVIPANLGVNPSLTITAMAERAMSLVPAAAEKESVLPLEAPTGYIPNGKRLDRRESARKVLFPLLGLSLLLIVVSMLFRKK